MNNLDNKIILGTVQFGIDYGINNVSGIPPIETIKKILDFAHSNNILTLDTADAYGSATHTLGLYLRETDNIFKINTKFKKADTSLKRQLDETLSILPIENINTYFFHNFEDFKIGHDLLQELIELKNCNLINKIGLSVYDNNEFREAISCPDIDVIQFPFNLLDNYNHRGKLIKQAKENGKELQVRSVFLQGLFFKNITSVPHSLQALIPYLKRIKNITENNNISIEELALGYALRQREIDNLIIGVDNLEQIKRNVEMAEKTINSDIVKQIDDIKVIETELLYPKNWKI